MDRPDAERMLKRRACRPRRRGCSTAGAGRRYGCRRPPPTALFKVPIDTLFGALAQYAAVSDTLWQILAGLQGPDANAGNTVLANTLDTYAGLAERVAHLWSGWWGVGSCDTEVAAAGRRGVDPYVVMEEAAAQVPAGSGGVVAIMSNLMNARRWVHASPAFAGFDLGNPAASGRGACIRALEEAGAYVARGHRDIITELTGLRFGEVTFTGGAAKGRLWPQIMADVLGVPVHIPAVTESSALGAAICAGVGAGLYEGLHELRPRLRRRTATFEPDQAAAAAYDERYAAWREIYRRMLALTDDGLLHPLWRAAGA